MLKVLSLGGVSVNKNMYVLETEKDILIVDCGLAFPDEDMPGIDLVIPDVSYLADKRQKIRAIFLSHGHDDHWGALPYLLPSLGTPPIYGTKLTIGLAKAKCEDAGARADWKVAGYRQPIRAGDFEVTFLHVTHSIPDAANLVIKTPEGTLYYGSDFKFDWTPVDGIATDVQAIASAGQAGILCLFSDCVRVEKAGYTLSEATIEETFDRQLQKCPGKFILTTLSSNISRIQQAINVAGRYDRKIVFAGRSIERSVEVSGSLGFLTVPKEKIVKVDDVGNFPANKLLIFATGALGQDNSALARIANGEHKIKIKPGDVVSFSQDPIPGSETAVDGLINTLIKAGADVYYSAILDDLHVSGHESADGLKLMLALTKPKFVWPIGGTIKHTRQYTKLAQSMDYKDDQIIVPDEGQIIRFENGKMTKDAKAEVKNILIDGLGIGDVGNVVLRDRKAMSADGVVMVIVPVEKATGEIVGDIDLVSRGFVYMKESDELIGQAKEVVRAALHDHEGQLSDFRFLKRHLADHLEKFLFTATHRRPLILPVIVEV